MARRSVTTALMTVLPLLALAGPARAQEHGGAHDHAERSPYAGMTDRAIKALSSEELAGLLAGEGLGFALAAELNGVPGPKHVLELAEELGLGPATAEAVEGVRETMASAARELGRELVEVESRLDRAFAEGTADAAGVRRMTAHAAELRGRLRAVHLVAHLETAALLTPEQVERYRRLRGYAPPTPRT